MRGDHLARQCLINLTREISAQCLTLTETTKREITGIRNSYRELEAFKAGGFSLHIERVGKPTAGTSPAPSNAKSFHLLPFLLLSPKCHLCRAKDRCMDNNNMNWIANFIWGIADDVLRDLYVRGKYRDVILPMTVLRRIDSLLESTKQAVLDMKLRSTRLASSTKTKRSGRRQGRPSTTRQNSRCATSRLAPASSSSRRISRRTSTASLPMSRTSWRSSNSAIRSRAFPRRTHLAR